MHVLISILIIVALVFGVVFFIPDGCFNSNVSQDDDTTIGDGSADSDVNITTATVDIDIVNGDGVSLKGKVMEFIGELGGGEVLFQPGALIYTQGFKIKNNSDVNVSYKMNVTRSADADTEEFHQAFNYYLVNNLSDLDPEVKLVEHSGLLAPGQASEMFYVVVTMKEDAGNEYQGRTFEGIGIHVIASQIQTEE